MLFRHCTAYEIPQGFDPRVEDFEMMASQEPARMCQFSEMAHLGFSPAFEGGSRRVHELESGQVVYLNLTRHERVLPAQVVRYYTAEKVKEIEAREGVAVEAKRRREIEHGVRSELRANAAQKYQTLQVILDFHSREMWIDQGTDKKLDMVCELISQKLGGPFPVRLIDGGDTPQRLKSWALDPSTLPDGVGLGESIKLSADDGEVKSSVTVKHELISDEEWTRIISQREVEELALETRDLTFVLSAGERMKSIRPRNEAPAEDEEQDPASVFDAQLWETVTYLRQARSSVGTRISASMIDPEPDDETDEGVA